MEKIWYSREFHVHTILSAICISHKKIEATNWTHYYSASTENAPGIVCSWVGHINFQAQYKHCFMASFDMLGCWVKPKVGGSNPHQGRRRFCKISVCCSPSELRDSKNENTNCTLSVRRSSGEGVNWPLALVCQGKLMSPTWLPNADYAVCRLPEVSQECT